MSSGLGQRAPLYLLAEDPYRPLLIKPGALGRESITVEDLARVFADAIDDPALPLRIPVGGLAKEILTRLKTPLRMALSM